MINRHVYIYWRRFSVWSQNYRLYSWISRSSYKFCSVATISWRNSLWFEIWSMSKHMMLNLEMSMQRREFQITMMSVHVDSRRSWQIKKSSVRVDSVFKMLDWLMQIKMHESRQRKQLMLTTQIQIDNYTQTENECQSTHKRIERIASNTRRVDHRM
jgi:hypothetical protein